MNERGAAIEEDGSRKGSLLGYWSFRGEILSGGTLVLLIFF